MNGVAGGIALDPLAAMTLVVDEHEMQAPGAVPPASTTGGGETGSLAGPSADQPFAAEPVVRPSLTDALGQETPSGPATRAMAFDPADLSSIDLARFAVPVLESGGAAGGGGSGGSAATSPRSQDESAATGPARFVGTAEPTPDQSNESTGRRPVRRRPAANATVQHAAPRVPALATPSATDTSGSTPAGTTPPTAVPASDRAVIRSAVGGAEVSVDGRGLRLEGIHARGATAAEVGGADLPLGLFAFTVKDVAPGGIAVVDLQLPEGSDFNTYYKQDARTGRLRRFDWDGSTGAVFHGRTVTLYLQDGGRGDSDGVANGVIVDPGGPSSEDFWIESEWGWSYVGEAVEFSVDTWLDPYPQLTLVEWDFTHMGWFEAEASGTAWSVSHTFNDPGFQMVAARLTPASGEPFVVTTAFDVYRIPPEVSFGADLTATAGEPVTIAATVDSEADILGWDWWKLKDGEDWVQLEPNQSNSLTYTFDEAGEYEVWLGVTDEYGEEGSASVFVTVEPADPTMTAEGPAWIHEGTSAVFDVTVLDPERFLDDPAVYADWEGTGDWEVLDTAEFLEYEPANGRYTIPHRYDNDPGDGGSYTAKFWVEDDWGMTDTAERSIEVRDLAPEVRIKTDSLGPGLRLPGENDDYPMVTMGMGGPVVPGPKVGYGLPRIGVMEGIGKDIYIISPGTNLILSGVDESFADQEGLAPVWTAPPGTTVNGNVLTVDVDALRRVLLPVKAKVVDPRGVESAEHTFYLTVEETNPFAASPLFGELKATAGWDPDYELPNPYAPRGGYMRQDVPLPVEGLKVRFQLTDESQAWADRVGGSVRYTYVATVSPNQGDPFTRTVPAGENDQPGFFFCYNQQLEPGQVLVIDAYATVFTSVNGQSVPALRTGHYNLASVSIQSMTPEEKADPTWLDQMDALAALIQELPAQFGALANNLVAALTGPNWDDAMLGISWGLVDGFRAYVDKLTTGNNALLAAVEWLLGAPAGSLPNVTMDELPGVILHRLRLDEDTIRGWLIGMLGEGNLEALDAIGEVFDHLDDPAHPIDLNDPRQMLDFLRQRLDLNLSDILNKIISGMTTEIVQELPRVGVELVLSFAPGFGMLKTLLRTGGWILANAQTFRSGLEPLLNLSQAALENASGAAVKGAVLASMPNITTAFLDFLSRQFGLDRIKRLFWEKIRDLPGMVEEKIKAFVRSKLPQNRVAPGGAGSPYVGQVGRDRHTFTYKNKSYEVIVARQSRGRAQGTYVIRLVHNGRMVVELDFNQIHTNPALPDTARSAVEGRFAAVEGRANALEGALNPSRAQAQKKRQDRRLGKANRTPGEPATDKVKLGDLAKNLKAAVVGTATTRGLLHDLHDYGCALLNAGCFAAGTRLWTPDGYRNVEAIRPGDLVFSRDEHRPDGPIEAKAVEQVFRRFTEVIHLHVGGQVIRTTDEHPFYVYNRGWVAVAELAAGMYLLTASGDWKRVEEVYRTGELEVAYNLRVVDHHTYFVGDDDWGWAAWAHNACLEYVQVQPGMAEGMALASETWQYRQQNAAATNSNPARRGAWARGEKTAAIAHVQGMAQGYRYGSGQTGHAEENMIRGLTPLGIPSPSNPVVRLVVERSPCESCRTALDDWLRSQSGPLTVYFIVPYVANEDGSVLLNRYTELGIRT